MMATRIKEKYQNEVVPALQQKFGYKNVMEVPKLHKVIINMGLGDCKDNPKSLELAVAELAQISGQKPMMLLLFRLVGVILAPGIDYSLVQSKMGTNNLPLLDLVNMGDYNVSQLEDGWTIVTDDGSLCSHYEHTIAINEHGLPELLTYPGYALTEEPQA